MSDRNIPEISVLSVEFVKVPFAADVDPETVSADLAIVAAGSSPAEGDWHEATVLADHARLLIGPGEVPLAPGLYAVWARIADLPETVVEKAGLLKIVA